MAPNPSYITLNDQRRIPQLGMGFWRTPAEQAERVMSIALEQGYRSFDTASVYLNEKDVGQGLRNAAVPRDSLFVTTKLWIDQQGYDGALYGFEQSCARLQLEYIDLYLIHWPDGQIVESWRALARLKSENRARSIGVSNFTQEHLERIIGETGIIPAVNQIELNPLFQQKELREFHARHGIATQSWAPLGQGRALAAPLIVSLASKYRKTPAQIVLRWHLDQGLIAIPKSVTPSRIAENIDVFDFCLDEEDHGMIAALDDPLGRIGPDPAKPYPYPNRTSD